jgi:hypothetical protein
VYYKSAAAAAHLVQSGLATVRRKAAGIVMEIDLTNFAIGYIQGQVALNRLGLHPGSFGIRTETFPSGVFCYEHRNAWEQVAP